MAGVRPVYFTRVILARQSPEPLASRTHLVVLQQHIIPADVEDVAKHIRRKLADLHERMHRERENRILCRGREQSKV